MRVSKAKPQYRPPRSAPTRSIRASGSYEPGHSFASAVVPATGRLPGSWRTCRARIPKRSRIEALRGGHGEGDHENEGRRAPGGSRAGEPAELHYRSEHHDGEYIHVRPAPDFINEAVEACFEDQMTRRAPPDRDE